MDDFMIRALIAGLGVALVAGPLGSFIVWRRMAYFGDTLAHSSLLGVGLGLVLGVSTGLAILFVCLGVALSLVVLQKNQQLASDTLLGILSHGALALGLTVVSLSDVRVDLTGYLFGDILAVGIDEIIIIYGVVVVIGIALVFLWRPLVSATVHEEMAHVEGVPVQKVRVAYMVMLAVVVAVAMKVVGILLVTSLLIIPAASVRAISRSPEQMAIMAIMAAALSVACGLGLSYQLDTPAGPGIVVFALMLFLGMFVAEWLVKRYAKRQRH